jgi:hypothetical protein
MHKCRLQYKGKALKDKQAKLNTIFEADHETTNEVIVVPINDI